MSYKIKILVTVLILISCGKKRKNNIDPTLAPYVNEFVKVSRLLGREAVINGIDVEFGSTKTPDEPDRVGFCQSRGKKKNKLIVIDKQTWEENSDEGFRIGLVFHELGHCVLLRDHHNDNSKRSIMKPIAIMGDEVRRNFPDLVMELFGSDGIGPEFGFPENSSNGLNSFGTQRLEAFSQ